MPARMQRSDVKAIAALRDTSTAISHCLRAAVFPGGALSACAAVGQRVERLRRQLAQLSSRVSKATAPFAAALAGYASEAARFESALRRTCLGSERLAAKFTSSLKILSEHGRLWQDATNRAQLWLLDQGWPPLLHVKLGFPVGLVADCKAMSQTEAGSHISQQIIARHDSDLLRRSILAEWERNPSLGDRRPILRAALEAHIRGEYVLSVPAILPQIEGFVAENFGHKGRMGSPKYKRYLKNLLRGSSIANTNQLVLRFLADFVLESFKHGDAIPFDLNRHAILHGADTSYANPSTSLKAILLLDLIVRQFRFAALERCVVFHRLDCRLLRRSVKKRTVYAHEHQAQGDGKSPCQVCLPGLPSFL